MDACANKKRSVVSRINGEQTKKVPKLRETSTYDDTCIKNIIVSKAMGCRFKKLKALSGYVTTSSGTSLVVGLTVYARDSIWCSVNYHC